MSSTLIDMLNSLKGSIWLHTILSVNQYKHDKGHFSIVSRLSVVRGHFKTFLFPCNPPSCQPWLRRSSKIWSVAYAAWLCINNITEFQFVNEQRQFLLSRFEHIIIHVGTSNLKDSQELVGGICCLGHVRFTHKDLELIFVYLFIGETFWKQQSDSNRSDGHEFLHSQVCRCVS